MHPQASTSPQSQQGLHHEAPQRQEFQPFQQADQPESSSVPALTTRHAPPEKPDSQQPSCHAQPSQSLQPTTCAPPIQTQERIVGDHPSGSTHQHESGTRKSPHAPKTLSDTCPLTISQNAEASMEPHPVHPSYQQMPHQRQTRQLKLNMNNHINLPPSQNDVQERSEALARQLKQRTQEKGDLCALIGFFLLGWLLSHLLGVFSLCLCCLCNCLDVPGGRILMFQVGLFSGFLGMVMSFVCLFI